MPTKKVEIIIRGGLPEPDLTPIAADRETILREIAALQERLDALGKPNGGGESERVY